MDQPFAIFDRALVKARRVRAVKSFAAHDFLKREMAARLAERLEEVKRTFPVALDLGCHRGELAEALKGKGGIRTLVQADLSSAMLRHATGLRVAADEEWLPFKPEAFDLAMSAGSLHWINDVPGALTQIRNALKPDGLLLVMLPGAETLKELREALTQAEAELEGGASPRVSPFIDVREAGGLLQRAGFALPVIDTDTLRVSYEDMFGLMRDLRGMGETNALIQRWKNCSRRATFLRSAEIYRKRFADSEGRIPATVELVTLTAWKPHESQPQAAKRGSGRVSLEKALGD